MSKELIILTGASGSGVSSARHTFEELRYMIIENTPLEVSGLLFETLLKKEYPTSKFCVIVPLDIALEVYQNAKKNQSFAVKMILLTANKNEILKRFTLSRHIHPLCSMHNISLEEAIDLDLKNAANIVTDSDICLDTSALTLKELRKELMNHLLNSEVNKTTRVTFMSFGLKNGCPLGLDLLFDVRVLPNPYWVESFSALNGYDKEVQEYLLSFSETKELLKHIKNYLDYHLEEVNKQGRPSYVVGIACSGGQHRSTFVAKVLADYFSKKYAVSLIHRDSPSLNEQ